LSSTESGKNQSEETTPTIADDRTWIQSSQLFHRPMQNAAQRGKFQYAKGFQIGKFTIEGPLGKGAMGEVYEAIDGETDRRVALKILPAKVVATADRKSRFLSEGKLAASIRHPNSLFIFDADEADGVLYIAMELCSGGNLRELVERDGALEQKKAVDLIIQICQGLSAAQSAGVIHRDIKPANCFLAHQDKVIVGDYGLSVSSLDINAAQLNEDGSFVGTPAFASPEQIRGQELDLRADIYSVGASLFYLLSGQTPFEGYSVKSLFTAIQEKDPEPLINRAPKTSKGLINIISRCLQKDLAKRYQDYDELIADLEQFSSKALMPASPPRRILAGFIDILLCQYIFRLVKLVIPFGWLDEPALDVLLILFTGVLEGTRGVTPGKALLKIRVQDQRGAVPGLGRGLLRATIFYFSVLFIDLLALYVPTAAYFFPFAFCWIFLPARKHNSWSAFHDILTRSKVVGKNVPNRRISDVKSALGSGPFDHRLGPYRTNLEYSNTMKEGTVLLGFDPQLDRKVWIRVRATAAPDIPIARRDLTVPFYLRWLNSKRSPTQSWDVYEALEGAPLIAATADANQPWAVVRNWLSDFVEASEFFLENEESSEPLTADRIWVTSEGWLVWLDFPAPGIKPSTDPLERPAYPNDLIGTQDLLLELGEMVSNGSGDDFQPRYPLVFSKFQKQLKKKSINSLIELKSLTTEFYQKSVELNRIHRMKMMALFVLYPLVAGFAFAFIALETNAYLEENHPQYELAFLCLDTLREYGQAERPLPSQAEEREWALKTYLAGPLRTSLPDTTKFLSDFEIIPPRVLTQFCDVLASTEEPGKEQIQRATEILSDLLSSSPTGGGARIVRNFYSTAMFWFFRIVLFWILLGVLFKGGVMYRVFGIAVVNRQGLEASRIRLTVRTLLAWSPILLTWFWLLLLSPYRDLSNSVYLSGIYKSFYYLDGQFLLAILHYHPVPLLMLAVFSIGGLWALVHPDRGLHDRIAGTYLVPR